MGKWRKACSGGAPCVEVRDADHQVQIRDSKLGDDSPILDLTPTAWRALVAWAREAG